ncbi:MAG: serine/threonine protein kinase [Deltaproteobacteria bacterium]|nr:serine/threonine protein kinase [Deltaproteobacteria bacterium]
MTEQEALRPGQTLGRYSIVRRLGAGGMGAVYEAIHADLKKRVAIKALAPSMVDDPDTRARFLREGEASARIRHPHVVDVYDVGFLDGVAFLVMEYLDGEDLGARLRREKPLSDLALAEIMLPVCAAVAAAHQQGVIHRDLKPGNIFLARGQMGELVPKVLDFGISKILADKMTDGKTLGLTNTGAVLGTPYYMSPEQAHGGAALDGRSDQYSLGVILYQCSTGQRPFDAPSMYQVLHRIVQGQFDPPHAVRPDIPEALEQVILKAMAREADDRYPSVLGLGAAMLPFAGPRSRVLWEPIFRAYSWPPPPESLAHTNEVAPAPLVEKLATSNTFAGSGAASAILHSRRSPLLFGAAGAIAVAAVAIALIAGPDGPSIVSSPIDVPRVTEASPTVPPASPPAPGPESRFFEVSVRVDPPRAAISLDGRPVGSGTFAQRLPIDGTEHTLVVTADGFEAETIRFKDVAPASLITLQRAPANAPVNAPAPAPAPAPRAGVKAKAAVAKPARAAAKAGASPKTEPIKRGANNAIIIE